MKEHDENDDQLQPTVPGFEHRDHEWGPAGLPSGWPKRFGQPSVLGPVRVDASGKWTQRHIKRLCRIELRNPRAGRELLRRLGSRIARRQQQQLQQGEPPRETE